MNKELASKGEMVIYKDAQGSELKVQLINETVWLTQAQMAELFDKNVPTVNEHIKNIYKTAELTENRTIRKFRIVQTEGKRQVERQVDHYNLDMIISVGYRVNSKRGTQFRIWATKKLRELILKGYVIHEQRLKVYEGKIKELESARRIFQQALETRRTEGYERDLLNIITDYLNTWVILNQYDKGELEIENVSKKAAKFVDHEKAVDAIERFRQRLMAQKQATDLFGRDTGHKLAGILESIKQSYARRELYPSLEEKAAHLFYFIIKDHPFVDGNKRVASLLFLLFLVENHYLYNRKGDRKINDAALAALALLVAESKPDQKDTMVRLIINLINKK
jgi:death-on-curing family protein